MCGRTGIQGHVRTPTIVRVEMQRNVLTYRARSLCDEVCRVQHVVVDSLERAHVPLQRIVAASGVVRSASHNVLYQTILHVNHLQDRDGIMRDAAAAPTVKLDLEVQLFSSDEDRFCDSAFGPDFSASAATACAATNSDRNSRYFVRTK